MLFPVSSGQHHRANENEWVPVEPSAKPVVKPVLVPPKKTDEKEKEPKQQEPAITIRGVTTTESSTTVTATTATTITATTATPLVTTTSTTIAKTEPVVKAASAINKPYHQLPANQASALVQSDPPPTTSISPSIDGSIFPEANDDFDVSSIIAKRLNAMRKLQENPNDPVALKLMYNSQKDVSRLQIKCNSKSMNIFQIMNDQMSAWANSKHIPGQFTGSTGANILSAKELTSGFQAWAKRVSFVEFL